MEKAWCVALTTIDFQSALMGLAFICFERSAGNSIVQARLAEPLDLNYFLIYHQSFDMAVSSIRGTENEGHLVHISLF